MYHETVQLINSNEIGDQIYYRVWVPGKNDVLIRSSSEFLPIDQATPLSREEIIYRAAAGKVAEALAQNPLISPLCSDVIPLPHQIHALSRAMQKEKVRYLLADEVGLGKTIEAGLVIKELKIRKRIKRTLILAPKGLVRQWIEEMRQKFSEDFKLLLPDSAEKLTGSDADIWHLFDQVVVSLDSVKPLRYRRGWTTQEIEQYNQARFKNLITAGWDLIIIDESHKLAGTSTQVARYRLGKGLASAAPHLLLLSATPHQGKTDAFLRLMSFLDKKTFHDAMEVSRDLVAEYVIRTEKRKAIDVHGQPLFKPRHTQMMAITWSAEHGLQEDLYRKVTEYVRSGYNKARSENRNYIGFLMVLMQRLVSSSTRAVRIALERRLSILSPSLPHRKPSCQIDEDWWDLDAEERVAMLLSCVPPAFREESNTVKDLLALARKCESTRPDAKAEVLNDLLHKVRSKENNPDLKFLIFTEFVTTQEMLMEFLIGHGFSVVCLNGSMSIEDRRVAQQQFAEQAHVMISTEAGGEGLNLQFCHIVINYDIPWNPMRLEQRIGRVDRIGQSHEVEVINFLFSGTVEERVHQILVEKLMVILQDLGFDKIGDVLDSGEAERSFEDLYLHAILEPEKAEERLNTFISHIQEQAKDECSSLKMLGSENTLSTHDAREYSQSLLPFWLEAMVTHYLTSRGGTVGRGLFGYNLVFPDGYSMNKVSFTHSDPESSGTQIINLSNRRIAQIFREIPYNHPEQPIAYTVITDLPRDIRGTWSLWRFEVYGENADAVYYFPYFMTSEGKVLITTAKTIWESLARGNFSFNSSQKTKNINGKNIEIEIKKRSEEILSEGRTRQEITAIDYYPVLIVKVGGADSELA